MIKRIIANIKYSWFVTVVMYFRGLQRRREVYKELKKIGYLLLTQNNRHTADVMFAIEVNKRRYGHSDWCDKSERRDEYDTDWLCESCLEEVASGGDLEDFCEECDPDCFVWYELERELDYRNNVFLTEEACEDHIKMNSYHYSEPISFGISAWRNPEMQLIREFLMDLAGGKK